MNSHNILESVDRFYIVLITVLILMAILVIFSFRGTFSAILSSYEIDPDALSVGVIVDKNNLNNAYDWVFERGSVKLEITD